MIKLKKIAKYITIIIIYVILLNVLKMIIPSNSQDAMRQNKNENTNNTFYYIEKEAKEVMQ